MILSLFSSFGDRSAWPSRPANGEKATESWRDRIMKRVPKSLATKMTAFFLIWRSFGLALSSSKWGESDRIMAGQNHEKSPEESGHKNERFFPHLEIVRLGPLVQQMGRKRQNHGGTES